MSNLYAILENDRGSRVTRTGHRRLEARLQGWNFGVYTVINQLANGQQEVLVYKTGGSNGGDTKELVTSFLSPKEDKG